jgi:NUMOD3 motif
VGKWKTIKDYEAEAHWEDECLIFKVKYNSSGNRITRKVYQLRHGPIASCDIFVCHTCDNPCCIRDEHHFLGTQKDNLQDVARKGRLNQIPRSKEHRRKLSEAIKGRKLSKEHREKISKSGIGKHPTDITRRKLSVARTLYWVRWRKNHANIP